MLWRRPRDTPGSPEADPPPNMLFGTLWPALNLVQAPGATQTDQMAGPKGRKGPTYLTDLTFETFWSAWTYFLDQGWVHFG